MMMTCNTRVTTLSVNMHCAENKYGMWMVSGSNTPPDEGLACHSKLWEVLHQHFHKSSRTQNSSSNSPFEIRTSDRHVPFFVCELLTPVRFHVAQHICTDETVSITVKISTNSKSSILLFRNALRDPFLRNDLFTFHTFLDR